MFQIKDFMGTKDIINKQKQIVTKTFPAKGITGFTGREDDPLFNEISRKNFTKYYPEYGLWYIRAKANNEFINAVTEWANKKNAETNTVVAESEPKVESKWITK